MQRICLHFYLSAGERKIVNHCVGRMSFVECHMMLDQRGVAVFSCGCHSETVMTVTH